MNQDFSGSEVMGGPAVQRPAHRTEDVVQNGFLVFIICFNGAGNDPASKITSTLALTRAPAGNRF